MNREREHLGKIEPIRDPFTEEWDQRLDQFIASSPELQARIQSLQSSHLSKEGFFKMISTWNEKNPGLSGPYRDREFQGTSGHRLTVKMDRESNVELGGHSD